MLTAVTVSEFDRMRELLSVGLVRLQHWNT